MKNPFNYLQFARGDQFYDRKVILDDLRSRILSGQSNVVIYGPRRYGKSSLVCELADSLEKEGIVCISFDMVKMAALNMFASVYATKIYRRLAPVRFGVRQVGDFFKHLRPRLSIGNDGEASFSFEVLPAEIGPEELSEVLDLPQRLSEGRRVLIVMDEFQEVESLMSGCGFERVMRSVIQNHRDISYIFLGSRYHMLRRMFTDHTRPFYKSALTMLLDKPPVEESVAFVASRFESAGLDITPDAARRLVGRVDNIPYYIQQLGFETFRFVDEAGRKTAETGDVDAAYSRLSGFNRDQYEQALLSFSAAQKTLLIALAKECTKEFDAGYRQRHGLGALSTLNSAKRKLIEDGHIEHIGGVCRLADPFFAEYLRD
jgi:hypothetical protein